LKKRWKLLKKSSGEVVEEFSGKREGVFPFREGEIFFCEGVYVKRSSRPFPFIRRRARRWGIEKKGSGSFFFLKLNRNDMAALYDLFRTSF